MSTAAKLFRVTIEVADLESATNLYRDLLDIEGKRHPGIVKSPFLGRPIKRITQQQKVSVWASPIQAIEVS